MSRYKNQIQPCASHIDRMRPTRKTPRCNIAGPPRHKKCTRNFKCKTPPRRHHRKKSIATVETTAPHLPKRAWTPPERRKNRTHHECPCGQDAEHVNDASPQNKRLLGRSPRKNCKNDLDDQTSQELKYFSTSKQHSSAKRHW